MTDPTSTEIIIKAMRILADDIQTDDGVANQAIRQAAYRLEAQAKEIEILKAERDALEKHNIFIMGWIHESQHSEIADHWINECNEGKP